MPQTLRVEIVEVQGNCPVYRGGESFYIEAGYRLKAPEPVCLHGIVSILPYYVALARGIPARDLGLAGPDGAAYVQCLDPHALTGGGTVTFRLTTEAAP